jgi:HSP20 family protein
MRMIWSPTRDLLQLHARLGRALGDPVVRRWRRPSRPAATMPALDFSETRESFLIRVDLPGLTRDEVEVNVADGSLEIAGQVPPSGRGEHDAQPRRIERFSGRFRRVVPLPRGANADAIQATLEQGVLTLQIPRAAPPGGRRIDIT